MELIDLPVARKDGREFRKPAAQDLARCLPESARQESKLNDSDLRVGNLKLRLGCGRGAFLGSRQGRKLGFELVDFLLFIADLLLHRIQLLFS